MVKTRVHDLAAEFGVSSEQLITLLKEMDIFVRSHLSALEGNQVALVRARWEREKRNFSETPSKGRRRRVAKKAAAPAAAETRTKRRRRTAAEMEEVEALARREREAAERQAAGTPIALEAEAEPKPPLPSIEERAAALFRDVPETAPAPEVTAEAPPGAAIAPAVGAKADAGAVPATATPASAPPAVQERGGPAVEPSPVPTTARPRPVASAVPGQKELPRPVASAAPGVPSTEERRRERKKRKKGRRAQVDQEAVAANISRTLATLKGPTKKGVRKRDEGPSLREVREQERLEELEREKTLVRVNEFITVSELAGILKVPATDIVTFAFKELGQMVTVNQRLDFDLIELIASSFGFQAVQEEEYVAGVAELEEEGETSVDRVPRSPVVTVMGHVDHGKTSLLDYIRHTNVVAGESGGITQHIGAYQVTLPDNASVTFLDTPGHHAFTAMRARGAQVTDIVVLVVAADDAVMPQTVEAISHAKSAGVPIVVAINKIDVPGANVGKVKHDLLGHEVVLEEFGGRVLSMQVSAKTGEGVDQLLEQILLQGELLDLKANPKRGANGTVIEGILDPGKGPIATVLIQEGTLRAGDHFICGQYAGRVRAMFDERGRTVDQAGPAMPAQVLGFEGVPEAGDSFRTVADAAEARDIAQTRQRLEREAQHRRTSRVRSLEELMAEPQEGEPATLPLIIKADQSGPAEALADALSQLSSSDVQIDVVHRGVGAINESDVLLAKASGAIIVGFHVRPDANARSAAEDENVEIRTYRVIYEAVEDVRAALEGLLKPVEKEVVLGEAEVLQLFKVSGVGTVAGCMVRHGLVERDARVRVVRDGVEIYESNIASLRRFKDDVREVREGLECGLSIQNFNDVKVGDLLETYRVEQVARSLDVADSAHGD